MPRTLAVLTHLGDGELRQAVKRLDTALDNPELHRAHAAFAEAAEVGNRVPLPSLVTVPSDAWTSTARSDFSVWKFMKPPSAVPGQSKPVVVMDRAINRMTTTIEANRIALAKPLIAGDSLTLIDSAASMAERSASLIDALGATPATRSIMLSSKRRPGKDPEVAARAIREAVGLLDAAHESVRSAGFGMPSSATGDAIRGIRSFAGAYERAARSGEIAPTVFHELRQQSAAVRRDAATFRSIVADATGGVQGRSLEPRISLMPTPAERARTLEAYGRLPQR